MTRARTRALAALALLLAAAVFVALQRASAPSGADQRRDTSGALELTLTAPDGSPAASAKVTMTRGSDVRQRSTDAQGRVRFERLAPGEVRVTCELPGAARHVRSVHVRRGPTPTSVAIRLLPGVTVSGVVVNDAEAPIAGAKVVAQPEPGSTSGEPFETVTDAQGSFALAGLAQGAYALRVQAERHELAVLPRIDVPLAQPLRVVLERTSRLHGSVLDPAGNPAASARVTIAGSGVWPPKELQTDAQGRFALEPVPSGVYELRARRDAWVAEPLEGVLVAPASDTEVNLRLQPGAELRGRVFDAATGAPFAALEVTLREDALTGAPLTARTDEEGRFAFSGLRNAPHRVWIAAPGYVAVAGETKAPGPAPIAFALRRAAVLSGTVVDELGHALARAELQVTGTSATGEPVHVVPPASGELGPSAGLRLITPPPAGDNLGVVPGEVPKVPLFAPPTEGDALAAAPAAGFLTDAAGRFRIEGVPAGRIQLVARMPGYAPTRTAPRKVEPGAELADLKIVLSRGATLLGRVLDAGGQPVSGVLVQLELEGEPQARATLSADDGRFAFEALRGRCTVTALPHGAPAVREQLVLDPGERREVQLTLSAEGRELAGRVLDARGFPIAAASIRVRAADERHPLQRSAVSAADGTFRLAGMPPPPYVVEVDHPDYATARLDEVAPEPGSELAIELRAGARVHGLALDRMKNEPLSGARVRLRRGKTLRTTRSDARGRFEFRNVSSGNYEVSIDAPNYVPERRTVAVEGADERELDPIALGPSGGLSGDVVDRLGAPVFDAEVAIGIPPDWGRAARTDERGRFRLTGLPPGEHWLSARHPQAGASAQPVLVRVYPLQESPGLVLRLSGAPE